MDLGLRLDGLDHGGEHARYRLTWLDDHLLFVHFLLVLSVLRQNFPDSG